MQVGLKLAGSFRLTVSDDGKCDDQGSMYLSVDEAKTLLSELERALRPFGEGKPPAKCPTCEYHATRKCETGNHHPYCCSDDNWSY